MGLLRITAAPEPDRFKQLRNSVPVSSDRDVLRHNEVIALLPPTSRQSSIASIIIRREQLNRDQRLHQQHVGHSMSSHFAPGLPLVYLAAAGAAFLTCVRLGPKG